MDILGPGYQKLQPFPEPNFIIWIYEIGQRNFLESLNEAFCYLEGLLQGIDK